MTDWYGWAGAILNVDLSNMKVEREALSREFVIKYIGASGFGARILYDEVGPRIDALDPENVIIVGNGPLSGTPTPSGGRYELVSKSPSTGIYLRSNGGGFFGPEMKWAGYDLIVIRGKAEKPVYLWINDDHVELKDATHLWGKDTWVTQRIIKHELGDPDIQVLKIGPAGENMCHTSAVISNLGRAAGTYGIGAVWGSKNLKAIAIRGNKAVSVAKPKEFIDLCNTLIERTNTDPMYPLHAAYGTPGTVTGPRQEGTWAQMLKEKHLRESRGSEGRLSQPYYLGSPHYTDFDPHFDKSLACFACAVHCSHFYTIKSGKHKGTAGEGLEAVAQLSAGSLISDAAFICKYNNVCNQLGLDVHAPSNGIRWAVGQYRDRVITKEETQGLDLSILSEELVLELLDKIAHNEGVGQLMDTYSLKRVEIRGAGIRETIQWSLGQNTSIRGFNHLMGAPEVTMAGARSWYGDELLAKLSQERYGDPTVLVDRISPHPKKALHVRDLENVCTLCDMTGACKFPSHWWFYDKGMGVEDFAQLISAATGVNFSVDDLNDAAERELLLERAFNAREGIRRIDSYPFAWHYLLKHGREYPQFDYSAFEYTLEDYDKLLDEYYRLRGCNQEGIPTREKLEQLGLPDVADDLEFHAVL